MPQRPPAAKTSTPKKGAWKVPAAIAVAAVAIGIGAFAIVRATPSVRTAATTTIATPVTSTSSTTAAVTTQPAPVSTVVTTLPTTVASTAAATTAPRTTTTVVSIVNTGMTSVQFAAIKSVIKQIAELDITPYEDCIRQSPYTLQMTEATLMVCVDDPALRLKYIKAALDRTGLIASSPPAYIDCYEAAIVTDEFSARLANPVGVGQEANTWAIDQFTAAGLACSKPKS
jgi:hypothetical protein